MSRRSSFSPRGRLMSTFSQDYRKTVPVPATLADTSVVPLRPRNSESRPVEFHPFLERQTKQELREFLLILVWTNTESVAETVPSCKSKWEMFPMARREVQTTIYCARVTIKLQLWRSSRADDRRFAGFRTNVIRLVLVLTNTRDKTKESLQQFIGIEYWRNEPGPPVSPFVRERAEISRCNLLLLLFFFYCADYALDALDARGLKGGAISSKAKWNRTSVAKVD